MNPELKRAYVFMHLAIVLWGGTGILGRLITLEAVPLVWWRMLITVPMLYAVVRWRGKLEIPSTRELLKIAGVGVVIAIHWLTFYGSIKLSNASVAASCLASTALFTAISVPLIHKVKFRPVELVLGVFTIVGILLIFQFQQVFTLGIVVGLISAALSGLFTIFNKTLLEKHSPETLLFYEILAGFLAVSLIGPFMVDFNGTQVLVPDTKDLFWLCVLSAFCTVLPMQMSYRALRWVSPFLMNLSINLEPIYTMIVAALLFGEHTELNRGFYIGTGIIIGSVAINGLLQTELMKRNVNHARKK